MNGELGALLGLLAGGALTWEMLVRGPSHVEVVTHHLRLPNLPGELVGARVVFVSDLHHRARPGFRELWVRAVVPRLDPSMILLGGDLLEHPGGAAHVMEMLGEWSAPLGIYGIHGNNEHKHADLRALTGQLEARGVRMLANSHVLLRAGGETFAVAGVDDPHLKHDDLERTLAGIPPGVFTLLLAHTPEVFPEAAARRVPLVLSGHTHGGQVRFPWLGALWCHCPRTGNRYQHGLYQLDESSLVLSKGVGNSILPVRLLSRPEVVVLELARA